MKSLEVGEFNRVALKNQMPACRTLEYGLDALHTMQSKCEDGSHFCLNEDGRIIFARYHSGTAVRRHGKYSIIRSLEGVYWLINSAGQLLMLD